MARNADNGGLFAVRIFEGEDGGAIPEEVDFANLNHPNVVEIHEVRRIPNGAYVAMQFVRGVGLDVLLGLAKGGLPIGVALRIVADCASGIAALHASRQPFRLHRGIRPRVFLVGADGVTRLVSGAPRTLSRSRIGVLSEALRYFAPEQSSGGTVDARADVYALGCVLWELLTGEHIFAGRSLLETTMRIMTSKARAPSAARAGIPKPLDDLVVSAISANANERPASAEALVAAIEGLGLMGTREDVAVVLKVKAASKLAALDEALAKLD